MVDLPKLGGVCDPAGVGSYRYAASGCSIISPRQFHRKARSSAKNQNTERTLVCAGKPSKRNSFHLAGQSIPIFLRPPESNSVPPAISPARTKEESVFSMTASRNFFLRSASSIHTTWARLCDSKSPSGTELFKSFSIRSTESSNCLANVTACRSS